MPNHIQNRLQVIGDNKEVRKVLTAIEGNEMQIDFNKIKPIPKELMIDSARWLMPIEHYSNKVNDKGIVRHLQEMKSHFDKYPHRKEEDLNNFFQGIRNYIDFGFATWYEWSIKTWGTKWNAYGQNDKRNTIDTIYFETA